MSTTRPDSSAHHCPAGTATAGQAYECEGVHPYYLSFDYALSAARFRASFNGRAIIVRDAADVELQRIEGAGVKRVLKGASDCSTPLFFPTSSFMVGARMPEVEHKTWRDWGYSIALVFLLIYFLFPPFLEVWLQRRRLPDPVLNTLFSPVRFLYNRVPPYRALIDKEYELLGIAF